MPSGSPFPSPSVSPRSPHRAASASVPSSAPASVDTSGPSDSPYATATVDDAPAAPKPKRTFRRKHGTGPRVRGIVKWFNDTKGYGFLSPPIGPDVFVHYSGIEGTGHRSLAEGQEVEFCIDTDDRGTHAIGVRVIPALDPQGTEQSQDPSAA